jgi:hypothetical protein
LRSTCGTRTPSPTTTTSRQAQWTSSRGSKKVTRSRSPARMGRWRCVSLGRSITHDRMHVHCVFCAWLLV